MIASRNISTVPSRTSYSRRIRQNEVHRTMESANAWTPVHASRAREILEDMRRQQSTLRHTTSDRDGAPSWNDDGSLPSLSYRTGGETLLATDSIGSRQSLAERAQSILEDIRRKRGVGESFRHAESSLASSFKHTHLTTVSPRRSPDYVSDSDEEPPDVMYSSGSDSSTSAADTRDCWVETSRASSDDSSSVLPFETRRRAILEGLVDVSHTLVPLELSSHTRTSTNPRIESDKSRRSSARPSRTSSARDLYRDNTVRLSTHLERNNARSRDPVDQGNTRSSETGRSSHTERRSVLTSMLESIAELKDEASAKSSSKATSTFRNRKFHSSRPNSRTHRLLSAREEYRRSQLSSGKKPSVALDSSNVSQSSHKSPHSIRELYETREPKTITHPPKSSARRVTPDAKKKTTPMRRPRVTSSKPAKVPSRTTASRKNILVNSIDDDSQSWVDPSVSFHKNTSISLPTDDPIEDMSKLETSGFFLPNDKAPVKKNDKSTAPGWSFTEFEWTSFDDQSVVSIWGSNPEKDAFYNPADPLDDLSMVAHSSNKMETVEETGTLSREDCTRLNLEERFAGGHYYIYYQTMDPDIVHEPVSKRKLRAFNRAHPDPIDRCSGGLYLIAVRTAMSEI